MLDWGRKQIENLEIDIKSTTKITDKNMVKLVLQKNKFTFQNHINLHQTQKIQW